MKKRKNKGRTSRVSVGNATSLCRNTQQHPFGFVVVLFLLLGFPLQKKEKKRSPSTCSRIEETHDTKQDKIIIKRKRRGKDFLFFFKNKQTKIVFFFAVVVSLLGCGHHSRSSLNGVYKIVKKLANVTNNKKCFLF